MATNRHFENFKFDNSGAKQARKMYNISNSTIFAKTNPMKLVFYKFEIMKWNEMKTSIAPNSSEGRAQRRNPSLSNSKEESREISMVVIREPGRRGARAEKPDRRNAF